MTSAIDTETPRGGHSRNYTESILAQLDRLPALPPVAARLLSLTTSEDSSARDIVEVVQSDAALTSALMRMVRRADLGAPRDVTTVDRAVTLLGFQAVRNLALSVQVFQAFHDPRADEAALGRRKGMWAHNLAVACAAELLAGRTTARSKGGEAFMCGLLHDIGKIALDSCFPKSYSRVVDRAEQRPACICDIERDVFGLDHTIAGKRLVTRWELAPCVVECVWLHHQPCDALPSGLSCPQLIACVHLADNLVRQHGIGFSGNATIPNTREAAASLGIGESALDEVIRALPQRMAPLVEAVGLDAGHTALLPEALLKANRQLGDLGAQLAEQNQRLELRSRMFEAVDSFIGRIPPHARPADVCAVAAQTLSETIPASAALVFTASGGDTCVYVGSAVAGVSEPTSTIVDWGGCDEVVQRLTGGVERTRFDIVRVPPALEQLWQQFHSVSEREPLWFMPLTAPHAPAGFALFRAESGALQPLRAALSNVELLASTIGLELAHTCAKLASERMAEELVDLNRRLHEAQAAALRTRSVAMIAEMAGGAAHELNNPLAVISGRAQLAMSSAEDPELRRSLEIIIEQTKRAAEIATDLMAFAKPDPPHPVQQSLRELLERLCQGWHERFSLTHEQLSATLAHSEVAVFVDPEHLSEILTALVANAAESGDGDGVRVEINSPSRPSDETVRIVVRDNGSGMTADVLEHAIDPFFSHRPAGRGRGLGLSKAYRLAEINGGRLWLESTPNKGTMATIELPTRSPHGA